MIFIPIILHYTYFRGKETSNMSVHVQAPENNSYSKYILFNELELTNTKGLSLRNITEISQ